MQPVSRPAPNVRQRQLGITLRRLREGTGLSADEVGRRTGTSQTKITRIENGRTHVGRGDLFLILEIYGITDPELRESYWTLALAGRQKGWWVAYRDVINDSLNDYIALESAADHIRTWSLGTIHGLLQTEGYARATFAGGPDRTPDVIDRTVAARLERQRRVTSGDLPLWAILDETVLTRPVGGPSVLRDQLDHLLNLPSYVTLQIVPFSSTWHPGLTSAFTLMDFTDYPEVAFIEAVIEEQYIDDPVLVSTYTLVFDQLRAAGVNPKDSRRMIKAARDRIEI